jgi:hypothetical protein
MEEILNSLLDLELIGTVAAVVFVAIQGLKVFKFVKDEDQIAKAAIISALVAGVGLATAELVPVAAPFISMFFVFFIGAMVAGLGYKYLVGPFFEKFGFPMSTKDLGAGCGLPLQL